MDELVMVVPATSPICLLSGFLPMHRINTLLEEQSVGWIGHKMAENDPGLRQICIAVILVNPEHSQVFRFVRAPAGDKDPVGDTLCIVVTGHVNLSDMQGFLLGSVQACLLRELWEELQIQPPPDSIKLLGAISSDADVVSGRHLGILFLVTVEPKDIVPQPGSKITQEEWTPILLALVGGTKPNAWSEIAHKALTLHAQARTPS